LVELFLGIFGGFLAFKAITNIKIAATNWFWYYNHVEKTHPQPLQQPNKPQKPTQTKTNLKKQ
jgi:hypothetical protein